VSATHSSTNQKLTLAVQERKWLGGLNFYMRKFLVIQFSKSELKYSHVIVVSGKMAKTVTISMKVD
jgi:hypothetical protein